MKILVESGAHASEPPSRCLFQKSVWCPIMCVHLLLCPLGLNATADHSQRLL